MKELSDLINEELRFDPIAEMERIAGKSYKEDDSIVWSSMLLSRANAKSKEELLKLNDDTYFGITIPSFLKLMERLGFDKVLEDSLDEGNMFRVFWHPDGLLAHTDSYWGDKSINGGSVHGFVKGNMEDGWGALEKCSHGPTKQEDVRDFSYDLREGLRHRLDILRRNFQFLCPWPSRPHFRLCSYMDWKGDYPYVLADKSHEARLERLPASIRAQIQS